MSRRRWLTLVVAALAVAGCGDGNSDVDSEDDATAGQPTVSDLWTRPSPPIAGSAAFYLEISNTSADDQRIVAVSSPGCAEILVHTTTVDGDVATMAAAAEADLTVDAGDRLIMEPLGLHVMCLGPEEPLVEGESFELTIEFAPAGAVTTTGSVENR